MLEAVLLKLNTKLAPGWALIQINFDPIQEIESNVGGGCSFVNGPFFTTLWYYFLSWTQKRYKIGPNLVQVTFEASLSN